MSTGVTISSISDYAILGCGSVGYAVAEELVQQGKDVLIIDRDESRVESLRDQDLDARTADISEPEVADLVSERGVVLILASDVESNKEAVKHIRDQNDGQFIVARASDPVSGDELEELGADVVINPPQSSPNPHCERSSRVNSSTTPASLRTYSRRRPLDWRSSRRTVPIRIRLRLRPHSRRLRTISASTRISSI